MNDNGCNDRSMAKATDHGWTGLRTGGSGCRVWAAARGGVWRRMQRIVLAIGSSVVGSVLVVGVLWMAEGRHVWRYRVGSTET